MFLISLTIDLVVLNINLKIENNNYYENPPGSCDVKRLLDIEGLVRAYLTLSLIFYPCRYFVNHFGTKKRSRNKDNHFGMEGV